MFYRKLFYTLFVSLGSFISLNCMQAQHASVWVRNESGSEIRATYQQRDTRTGTDVDVVAGDIAKIASNADDLVLLKVAPYGRIRGKMSAEKLTLGYYPSENLVDRIQVVRKQAPHRQNIIVTVKLKPGLLGSVWPYDYPTNAQDIPPRAREPKPPFTFALFPKVVAAKESGKKIEPRYFLDLPEGANNDDIQTRYQQLMDEWGPEVPAEGKNPRDYTKDEFKAKEAVKFIKIAYDALMYPMKGRETFDRQVEEEAEAPTLLS